jgi:hypothetical protein
MSTQPLSFPTPVTGDPNEVAHALSVGSAEWGRGDRREAVRWVHRAADAAEAAGDDRRAVGLARAAADLMSSLGPESSTPKPRDEGAALAPFDDFNDQTIVDSPAIQAARTMQHSAVTISERPSKPPPPPRPAAQRSSAAPLPSAPRARTALRVAVVRNNDDERVIIANVLDEGASAPAGTSEALLVLLDPNAAWGRDGG